MPAPYTEKLSQLVGIPAHVDPVSQAAGTVLTEAIDMSKFSRVMLLMQVGAVGAAGTVQATAQSAATSGGAYSNISPTIQTTSIAASNQIQTLEVKSTDLAAGQQFVKFSIAVGTNAVLIAAVVIGVQPYNPSSSTNIGAVTIGN